MKQGSKGIWDKVRGMGKTDDVAPSPSTSRRKSSRLLWGEHFDVVDEGLSESQIVPFVEDLLARYNRLLEQRGSTGTVNSYLQKVMGEIDQIQSTVTSQIRKDAETEASRIINESREIARGITAEARKEAAEIAAAFGLAGPGTISVQLASDENDTDEDDDHMRTAAPGAEAIRSIFRGEIVQGGD